MSKYSENPLYDERFRESLINNMPYDGPLSGTQEQLMSILVNEHYQGKKQLETSKKNEVNKNEYCDRCNSYRYRGKRNMLTCKCPPE